MGVVKGAAAIVPRIKRQNNGGWLINIASMAGMAGIPYAGAYTASKVAVVGMSEAWLEELAPANIHVAVVCPGFVKSRIHLSIRNRQDRYQNETVNARSSDSYQLPDQAASYVENGIDTELVGKRVVEAISAGEHYIFTHPSYRGYVHKRGRAIDAAFERSEASPLLQDLPDEHPVGFG